MSRPLRIQYPGAFYHITARGNERRSIFSGPHDREKLLYFFSEAVLRYGVSIHTYCLMENHYHILLETSDPNLSQALHFINGGYATYYNRAHRRSGHLLQGRYRAILVEKDQYALALSRYIHLNPVRAGVSEKPDDYPWSSYRAYLDPRRRPSWLETSLILGYFGPKEAEARRRYRKFVEDGLREKISDPLDGLVSGVLLGTEDFINWVKESSTKGMEGGRDIPAVKQLRPRLAVDQVTKRAEAVLGKDHRWLRDVSLYLCHRYSRDFRAVHNFTFGADIVNYTGYGIRCIQN